MRIEPYYFAAYRPSRDVDWVAVPSVGTLPTRNANKDELTRYQGVLKRLSLADRGTEYAIIKGDSSGCEIIYHIDEDGTLSDQKTIDRLNQEVDPEPPASDWGQDPSIHYITLDERFESPIAHDRELPSSDIYISAEDAQSGEEVQGEEMWCENMAQRFLQTIEIVRHAMDGAETIIDNNLAADLGNPESLRNNLIRQLRQIKETTKKITLFDIRPSQESAPDFDREYTALRASTPDTLLELEKSKGFFFNRHGVWRRIQWFIGQGIGNENELQAFLARNPGKATGCRILAKQIEHLAAMDILDETD